MSVRKTVGTVGTLAQEAVSTAVSVARHPIGSASVAVGFAKGLAGAGIDLVRGGHPDESGAPADSAESAGATTTAGDSTTVESVETPEDPRDDLPGPDLALFEPPRPEDLPEPIVIEAVEEPGEAFQTEPKAASRASAHGGPAGDREEAEGYVEEIPDDLADSEDLLTAQQRVE